MGPSNRFLALDLNQARSEQWYQEFRLQSSFEGPINFSVGTNYLHYKTAEDYYVFLNAASALAQTLFICTLGDTNPLCPYTDPNPLSSLSGDGHNYFRSSNPYKVNSQAVFGEVYWQVAPAVKITGGLRFTNDSKTTTPVPSQLLLAPGLIGAGFVGRGYPASPDIKQNWKEPTGKIGIDWKPELGFTDQTLVYASYSRGYKGGGANPPPIGANPDSLQFIAQPNTFKPEFINAFEFGLKNTLLGGSLTLNGSAFLYDYKDYQVSQIVDRTALNENIDATLWGLELESLWQPSRNFSMNLNIGYLHSRIHKNARSIDVFDRTQGNPDWTVVKPFLQLTSNCVVPTEIVKAVLSSPLSGPGGLGAFGLTALCGGNYLGDFVPGPNPGNPNAIDLSQLFGGLSYDPLVDAPNGGQGFYAPLGGNELLHSPHLTLNVGANYTVFLPGWEATLHGDFYHQSQSFARIYNTAADRLKGWENASLSFTIARPDDGLSFQFYIKNVFNDAPITDAFVNSDDSGLTTNVFTLDPRIFGFNVTKTF